MKRTLAAIAALLLACPGAKTQEPELILEELPEAEPPAAVSVPLPADSAEPATLPPPPPENGGSRWQFGITAGDFHSAADWLVITDGSEHNGRDYIRSHPGATAGFVASYPFGEVWSFDTGVNFSWWGFGYRDSGIRMKTERYMVEIPVLITFFESDAYIPVFLQAGVLTGILAGGRINVTADADYGEWTPRRAGDSFNRVSFGLILGIGYGHFTFQFIQNFTDTWNRGMLHTWENFTGDTVTRQTSRAYSLTYTYWF